MDQPTVPNAAELGISDAEYDRIMRDVQRRRGDDPTSAAPAPAASRSRRMLIAIGLLGLFTALVVVFRPDPKPTYAFLYTSNGVQPVTYTSCRPIQVAVYPADGPPDAEQLVKEAVAQLRTATGLDILFVGAFGGHAPNWNFEAGPVYPDDPISVSWQDSDAIARLTDRVAGLGGSRIATGPSGTQHLVAGTIALSDDYYAYLSERADHAEALAVLLHEFGHVFGLDHVNSRNELMNDDNTGRTAFGTGDLQGLKLLGQGPCT